MVIIAPAVLAGMALASYDLRTDDTGIEVGLLLIASATLAAFAPRRWWIVALCVGLPIPITEIVVSHAALVPGGIAALAIAIVGALIGFGSSRASRTSAV